jgi:NADH-quinone oxidoreductase subunit J
MMLLAQAAEAGAGNTAEIVLFWVFAVLALGSAIAVITMRNIVHGALMLVLNFLAIAGLYLTLESRSCRSSRSWSTPARSWSCSCS